MPFDSPKDAVFREILVFAIIFDFPGFQGGGGGGVNRAQK